MKAVIYCRFSPRRKKEHETLTLEAQEAACRDYCKAHSLEVISVECDKALSGKSDERPGFQAAIEKACKEKAAFVVFSLSRFARSVPDALKYVEKLSKAGADLVSLHEAIDTSSATGRFVYTVLAALAALQREQTAEWTSEIMLQYQKNGRRMSKKPPYGTQVDPNDKKKLLAQEEEMETIARICELRNEHGLTYQEIIDDLSYHGIKARGKRFYKSLIWRILHTTSEMQK